jgi:hypothetical protein
VRAEWRAERAGWAALATLVLAATLGVFGAGPLAVTEATGSDGLAVRFARFARVRLPDEMNVALPHGVTSLRVSRRFLADLEVLAVSPAPLRVRSPADEHVYAFEDAGDDRIEVTLRLQHARAGLARGWVAAGAGPRVTAWVFVHP